MVGVGKIHKAEQAGSKRYLPVILYGAKIGVLGLNGAEEHVVANHCRTGQRIRRRDHLAEGNIFRLPSAGTAAGCGRKRMKEIVEEGVHEIVALIKEYEAVTREVRRTGRRYRETFGETGQPSG